MPPSVAVATAPEGTATAALVARAVAAMERAIADEPKANRVLLRGFSQMPHLPPMGGLYRLRLGAFAGYPLYRGVAAACGMTVVPCGKRIGDILDTVAAPHDLDSYLVLLARDGSMVLVGAPAEPHPATTVFNLIMKRRQLAGSLIGGIAETQEMLDFCAQHGITAEIEIIPIQKINEAYERMLKSDVKYRFVIDMASLKQEAAA